MSNLHIRFVKGGFILDTEVSSDDTYTENTEVFSSPGKLVKAVRAFIEENSLVAVKKDEATEA